MKLRIAPIDLKTAYKFVNEHHRHHKAPPGAKFAIAVRESRMLWDTEIIGIIRGVAIVGRPVNRHNDNGVIAEVTRLCTDGAPNACSMLYAAAWKAAKGMGYDKIITYILESEHGTSLKAAGWHCLGEAGGGSWNGRYRKREDKHPTCMKIKYQFPEPRNP